MKLSSPVFQDGEEIPSRYACEGESINPPLIIEDVVSGAQSLALVMDDPDAPAGIWTHWVLWNISPETAEIFEDSVPENALEGENSSGNIGYDGPCPPSGIHHYSFRVYALDAMAGMDLPAGAAVADAQKFINDHILESAELTGIYSRKV